MDSVVVKKTSGRYETLDSLRGLAAFTVMIWHFIAILPFMYDDKISFHLLKKTPLAIIRAGNEAVIFFFILSGFVLSLPFFKKKISYGEFLIKRIFRIYLPYLFSILFALFLMHKFYRFCNPMLSTWFNQTWLHGPSPILLINHFFLVPYFATEKLNPVIWSLVHEMRISIVFPVLFLLTVKFDWRRCLFLATLISIAGLFLNKATNLWFKNDFFLTVHYTGFFILGILLAKEKDILVSLVKYRSKSIKTLLILTGILMYTFDFWFLGVVGFRNNFIKDWMAALGAVMFLIFALSGGLVTNILRNKCLTLLGKISYSFYLYHAVILLALVHLFFGVFPLLLIWITAFLLSVLFGGISYVTIEKLSIKYGHIFAQRFILRPVFK